MSSLNWEEGLPLSERPLALKKLADELDEVTAEEARLRLAASEAGLKL